MRNGVSTFLGIPYAAPPVGAQRWQPPQPVAAWTQTLNAAKFANTCPQITELGVFAGPVSVTEDCLFLNVFTPHANNGHANNGKKLPVLVWIHGGGLFDGESDDYEAPPPWSYHRRAQACSIVRSSKAARFSRSRLASWRSSVVPSSPMRQVAARR